MAPRVPSVIALFCPTSASPCEAELQELMEQIDIMVSNKKLDWERKMRALETRLDLRDQELANAQTCLDQKGQEVLTSAGARRPRGLPPCEEHRPCQASAVTLGGSKLGHT